MAISLTKGGNVSLTKEAPGITKTTVGLGWNPRVTDGAGKKPPSVSVAAAASSIAGAAVGAATVVGATRIIGAAACAG